MSTLSSGGEARQRQTRAQLQEAVQRLRHSSAYTTASAQATEALSKHEQSAARSQQITEDDLSVQINER